MFFRKKIKPEEFVELMLEGREEMQKMLLQIIKEDFDYSGNEKNLKFEVVIFSLWILTLSMPPSKKMRDLLHEQFCQNISMPEAERDVFYQEIDKRYQNYFYAFNLDQKNPSGMVGTVITEIIMNQNPNFILKNFIPTTGATDSMKAFMLFRQAYDYGIAIVDEIKNEYKIQTLFNLS
ncbi:hypothetical protein KJ673_02620 [Patescibacteria group bacterium]|nr:hypothetical protein [Patescibacteria group bacterium]MCG2687428.1 hypothetical protein [Candidatus Parcubacteria bacterium]